MNYVERKKWFCINCPMHVGDRCGYFGRGLQDKCETLQDFLNGYEVGWQDAMLEMEKCVKQLKNK